jgi:hypothetical protein
MQYKAKVLKRFPNAVACVHERWPDGSAKIVTVYNITDDGEEIPLNPGFSEGGYGRAWRNAYYWCARNPTQEYRELAARHGISIVSI